MRLAVSALLLEMTRMDGEIRPEQRRAVDAAVRTIAGSARSMGLDVEGVE